MHLVSCETNLKVQVAMSHNDYDYDSHSIYALL